MDEKKAEMPYDVQCLIFEAIVCLDDVETQEDWKNITGARLVCKDWNWSIKRQLLLTNTPADKILKFGSEGICLDKLRATLPLVMGYELNSKHDYDLDADMDDYPELVEAKKRIITVGHSVFRYKIRRQRRPVTSGTPEAWMQEATIRGQSTLVNLSTEHDQLGSLNFLHRYGVHQVEFYGRGEHPVAFAIHKQKLEFVDALLSLGFKSAVLVRPRESSVEWLTPITHAVQFGDHKLASVLFRYISPNEEEGVIGLTPLVRSILKNDMRMMKLLLDHGAHVNPVHNKTIFPLGVAVANNNVEAVELLLDLGADIDNTDAYFYKALDFAIRNNLENMAVLLLNRSIRVTTYNVKLAARFSTLDALVKLIERPGVAPHFEKSNGLLITRVPDRNGRLQVLMRDNPRVLAYISTTSDNVAKYVALVKGIFAKYQRDIAKSRQNLIVRTKNPMLLHFAVKAGLTRVVEDMLQAGADPNALTAMNPKRSTLQTAIRKQNLPIIRLLLKKSADVNSKGGRHGSPLNAVKHVRNKAILCMLIGYGVIYDSSIVNEYASWPETETKVVKANKREPKFSSLKAKLPSLPNIFARTIQYLHRKKGWEVALLGLKNDGR
ncbi:hypothetical protein PAAG_08161 [Paracoccidioides lutzii Pb01]|uniref:Uncharacterized protein n=1 Tax=Paracoccidioides lutzii (strain ATCC MYA-826 / Pb01) TaxID=502779 RepID=C1HBM0_PARBA|nr:hypothetical protein PAAG_08161 [Paracoccidioides lutzii Pb01]EEH38434.2 hypothetical protein PAAG_08161 [Paracoccidioides lutzii Pb01]